MIVEGEYTFQGPRDVVWNLLQDPEVLVKAMPGARSLERVSEDEYRGVMDVGVGPVTAGEFQVKVTLEDKVVPERYTMKFEGKGAIGHTRGSANIELTETEPGTTTMTYRGDVRVGGKIASVGQRLLDMASKSMTRQGLEAMSEELNSRLGVEPGVPVTAEAPVPSLWTTRRMVIIAVVLLAVASLFGFCGGT